jgi:nitrite reductase/ring-hydroxylating ferredoxin subunit
MVATLFAAGAAASPASALVNAVSETRATSARGLLRTYALPPTDSISVDVDNDLILARWQNRVHAFSLKCPHRGTRLEWLENEKRIFCPKHKARFRADGAHDSGRSTRSLDRYALHLEGGAVVVELDTLYRVDENPAGWNAAVIAI